MMTRLSQKQVSKIKSLIKHNEGTMERYACIGGEEADRMYDSAADSIERMTRWLKRCSPAGGTSDREDAR